MASKRLRKTMYVYRSAVTGKFVSRAWAALNPDTTIRQRVRYCNPQAA